MSIWFFALSCSGQGDVSGDTSTFASPVENATPACESDESCLRLDSSLVCDIKDSKQCEPAKTCGNGVVEPQSWGDDPHESCDDGNLRNGDGCSSTCTFEYIKPGQACGPEGKCENGICDQGICERVRTSLVDAPGPFGKRDHFLFGAGAALTNQYLYASRFGYTVCEQEGIPGCRSTGAVEVFRFDGQHAVHQAQVLPPQNAPGVISNFGGSMVSFGNTVVFSSGDEDGRAIFVYDDSDGIWSDPQIIEAPGSLQYRLEAVFGTIMAVGSKWLAIGLPWSYCHTLSQKGPGFECTPEIGGGTGRVLLYRREGKTWTKQATMVQGSGESATGFGSALAIDGDRLVVSNNPFAECATIFSGHRTPELLRACAESSRVFVYDLAQGHPQLVAQLPAENYPNSEGFGASVALEGDVLAVGAPNQGDASKLVKSLRPEELDPTRLVPNMGGRVYVYGQVPGGWNELDRLHSRFRHARREFGQRVVLHGGRLIVGANANCSPCRLDAPFFVNDFNWKTMDCSTNDPTLETFRLGLEGWKAESLLFPTGSRFREEHYLVPSISANGSRIVLGHRGAQRCPEGVMPGRGEGGCRVRGAVSVYDFGPKP